MRECVCIKKTCKTYKKQTGKQEVACISEMLTGQSGLAIFSCTHMTSAFLILEKETYVYAGVGWSEKALDHLSHSTRLHLRRQWNRGREMATRPREVEDNTSLPRLQQTHTNTHTQQSSGRPKGEGNRAADEMRKRWYGACNVRTFAHAQDGHFALSYRACANH